MNARFILQKLNYLSTSIELPMTTPVKITIRHYFYLIPSLITIQENITIYFIVFANISKK